MRRYNSFCQLTAMFLVHVILLIIPSLVHGLTVPTLKAHINDYAGMISKQTAEQLEKQLVQLEKSDTTQIVVLTISSLEGENLEEYSIRVAEAWKIGKGGIDNGVILLVVHDDRRIRIEVGRGLEGKLTDLLAGRIVTHKIIPAFQKGNFEKGIKEGLDAIRDAVKGEFKAKKHDSQKGKETDSPFYALVIFFAVALALASSISKLYGAATGAFGFYMTGKVGFPAIPDPLLLGLAFVGLVVGVLLNILLKGGIKSGRGTGGHRNGGVRGDSGGNSGFSGGGGSYGGGGASGKW